MAEENIFNTRIQLRHDSAANWTTANPVLLQGECGIELDTNKFKFGDGTKKWSELDYAGTQIKIEGEGEVIVGAALNAAGELVLTKGKLHLEDVYLTDGLTFTADIGVQKVPASGSGTLGKEGDSLKQLLSSILAKEANPTTSQPTVVLNSSNIGAKEVGTNIALNYSFTTNAGRYTYGPATGVTFSDFYVVFNAKSYPGFSGTIDSIQVTDGMSMSITGGCKSTAGAMPVTNLGNEYPAGQIKAKEDWPVSKGTLSGYRNSFWGSVNSKDGLPDSATIRALAGKKNGAIAAGNTGDATEAVGAMRVIIAVPAPRTLSSIKDVNGLNAEALSAFTKITVSVEGANGYKGANYNVYYKDNAGANDKANKWHFTVA